MKMPSPFTGEKQKILETILTELEPLPEIHAAWLGGSAATKTLDSHSDIDLCFLADDPIQDVIEKVQTVMEKSGVKYHWQPQKNAWGDGIVQRVIAPKDGPEFFSVDLAVFDRKFPQLLKDFLEKERHGEPVILFDKDNLLHPGHTNPNAWTQKQKLRVSELNAGFQVFKNLTQKEIARGNAIDALAFYQNGILRPLIEIMGMTRRSFRHDFGMRYLHRDFSKTDQELIEELSYVPNFQTLPASLAKAEVAWKNAVDAFTESFRSRS